MKVFADTNFLISLYFKRGGDVAQNALINYTVTEGPVWISRFVELEMINAIERMVFEGNSGGPIRVTTQLAALVQSTFSDDLSNEILVRETPVAAADHKFQYTDLVLRHTAKHGFRTYDMLHISSALTLGCDAFWSFDKKANMLAAMEGLKTMQP